MKTQAKQEGCQLPLTEESCLSGDNVVCPDECFAIVEAAIGKISNTKKIHRPQNKSKSEKKVGNQLRALLKMLEMVQKK